MNDIYEQVEQICADIRRICEQHERDNDEWLARIDKLTKKLEEQNQRIDKLNEDIKTLDMVMRDHLHC